MEEKDATTTDYRKTSSAQSGYRKRVMRRVNEDSHTQEPVASYFFLMPAMNILRVVDFINSYLDYSLRCFKTI
ncbi:hypothetical protein X798_05644 [Onchocerca flexuosa]|uniref:Uncharacterized protein n=1 Tax=Onchocerca flexuosa TaxID=387005 RepID=A0A238BQS4_9BILA|nr:hypothetical protein X798_05644 [Onchocerca flexuosa]